MYGSNNVLAVMNFHCLGQELLSPKKLGYMNSAFDTVFYTMFSRFDGIIIRNVLLFNSGFDNALCRVMFPYVTNKFILRLSVGSMKIIDWCLLLN
jgi:hypothetical protein